MGNNRQRESTAPSILDELEMVGDSGGNSLCSYQGQIFSKSIEASQLRRALMRTQRGGGENKELEQLTQALRLSWIRRAFQENNLQEPEHGSVLGCVVGGRRAVTLIGGALANTLAPKLNNLLCDFDIFCRPLPRSPSTDMMLERFRSANGFPAGPRWLGAQRDRNQELADLAQGLLGSRLVILIADLWGYWEIDEIVDSMREEGTPILPVTFSPNDTSIGPLIVGGNTSAFYLSKIGETGDVSKTKIPDLKLLSCGAASEVLNRDAVVAEIANIIRELPDRCCFSTRQIGVRGDIEHRNVTSREYVLRQRLHGRLWSIESILTEDGSDQKDSWAHAARHVQQGDLVSVRSAFKKDFAEIMHQSLQDNRRWTLHEKMFPLFFYHHHNIYDLADLSPSMLVTMMVFSSSQTVEWAEKLVGRDCRGRVQQSPSWYMAGDHSTPHSDDEHGRQLAFVWHLTKDWDLSWGGHFVWIKGNAIIPPTFNTLHLFDTRKSGHHFVMKVAPNASGQRLCWNGWWCSSQGESSLEIAREPTAQHVSMGRFDFRTG